MCGSHCTVIKMHVSHTCGSHAWKLLLYGGGEPSRVAHMWQLTSMVITRIWWRGPLMCGQLTCTLIKIPTLNATH